jgi:phosphatidylglycerophosphatase A
LGLAALPWWLWLASGLGLCALGVWSSTLAEEWFAREDDARIVIDEVAGQVIALAPLLFFRPASLFSGLVTGFVAFRLFDIWKPGPVRWAERGFRGGVGVMADDIVAGIMAASILVVLGALGLLEWFDAFASGGFVESQEVQPL